MFSSTIFSPVLTKTAGEIILDSIMTNPVIPRIGLGYDSHKLIDGAGLKLGGVTIPHDKTLQGHSDADALLHAVSDALLGAAALGDIGLFFPDTAEENRGRDSAEMLKIIWEKVQENGYRLGNIDAVILAQKPKLLPFIPAIQKRIAEILSVSVDAIGLKAKTGEGVGPVGEQRLIEVYATAIIYKQ